MATAVETNVEFVTRLMEESRYGVLTQAFVIEAIGRYAEQCSRSKLPKDCMISPEAWQGIANEILEKLTLRNG